MGFDRKSSDQLLAEATALKEQIRASVESLAVVYETLERDVRRPSAGRTRDVAEERARFIAQETARPYLQVAQAGRRFAGMVSQGLKRMSPFERIASEARRVSEDAWQEKEEKRSRVEAQRVKRDGLVKQEEVRRHRWLGEASSEDDFQALYGEG